MSFVHLHVHSEFSWLDGACIIDDLVRKRFSIRCRRWLSLIVIVWRGFSLIISVKAGISDHRSGIQLLTLPEMAEPFP